MSLLNNAGKGNLFLIEMIISLLFFSISGAVILRVFAAADVRAAENSARESAVLYAQSLAEVYSVTGNAAEACEKVFGVQPQEENGIPSVYLDSDFKAQPIPSDITLTLSETVVRYPAGELTELKMAFSSERGELFRLSCSAYIPDKGGVAG